LITKTLPGIRKRSLAKTLATLALSLLLLLVLVDLALGHILGLGNNIVLQPDPGAGYVFAPNQHVHRFFKDTSINGSTQLDQKAIFASLLASELPGQLHQPVEVLNASASAWAIGNEAGYLDSHGTYDADLVVVVVNTGDSLQATSTLADVGGDAATVKSPCALCEVWTRYLRDRIFHTPAKMDAGTAPANDSPANAALNLQHLEHFYQVVQQHHARMAVVFLAMRLYIPANAQASAPGKLIDWAQQHQVPLLDTTAAESSFSLRDITLDGVHFNPKGHRTIATYLEQHWNQLDPPSPN
jgi:hypothetical protein